MQDVCILEDTVEKCPHWAHLVSQDRSNQI